MPTKQKCKKKMGKERWGKKEGEKRKQMYVPNSTHALCFFVSSCSPLSPLSLSIFWRSFLCEYDLRVLTDSLRQEGEEEEEGGKVGGGADNRVARFLDSWTQSQ